MMDFLVKYTGVIVALHVLLESHQFHTTRDTHTFIPPPHTQSLLLKTIFSFFSNIPVFFFLILFYVFRLCPHFLLFFVLVVLLFVVVDVPPFSCNYLPSPCSSPVSFTEFVSVHAQPIAKQNLYHAIGGVYQNLPLQTKYLLATLGCTSHNAYHSCWLNAHLSLYASPVMTGRLFLCPMIAGIGFSPSLSLSAV